MIPLTKNELVEIIADKTAFMEQVKEEYLNDFIVMVNERVMKAALNNKPYFTLEFSLLHGLDVGDILRFMKEKYPYLTVKSVDTTPYDVTLLRVRLPEGV